MNALQRMAHLHDSPAMQALQRTANLAAHLHDSPAMQALRKFSNLPFSSAERERVFSALDSLERTQPDPGENPDFSIGQDIQLEIQRELEGDKDYNALSE